MKLYHKVEQAENHVFDVDIDVQIINAHVQKIPFIGVPRIDMPLYRCYFYENRVIACCLHHMTPREYRILQKILGDGGINPCLDYFILYENRVVKEGKVNVATLTHALFHLFHRVANKYIWKDYVAGIYE